MVIVLVSGFVRPQQTHASTIVERWRGTINVQAVYNLTTGIALAAVPGVVHETYTMDFDLSVDDTGFLSGDVYGTLQTASFEQYGNICGIFLKCRVSQSVGNPHAQVHVEGIRYLNAGQPEFSIDHVINISPGSKIDNVTLLGFGTNTDSEDWYPDILRSGQSPYVIQPYNFGRPPTAQPHSSHINLDSVADFTFSGQLIGTGMEPLLDLDPELLERSIFVAQVPIDDNFDANVDWNSSDAGWVTWQLDQQGPERVGPTRSTKVPKNVNVGFPNPGQATLQVQAHNTIGKDSQPQTAQITVAPPVQAPNIRTTPVSGQKQGDFAAYKFGFKFPEPVFKAQVKNIGGIPFLDKGPLGIADTQAAGEVEFKSTGEGSAKAAVSTAFEAMGGQAKGEVSVKSKAKLTKDGLTFPEGEFGLKVSGKIKSEEPLIVVIPSVGVALNNILSKFPAALSVINRAKVVVEAEPKIDMKLTLQDKNGEPSFKSAQAQPGMGLSASLVLDLIKDYLTAIGTVGGETVLKLQVPPPYFQGGDAKLYARAQIVFLRDAYNAEASYNGTFLPSGFTTVKSSVLNPQTGAFEPITNAAPTQGAWQPLDASYLNDPHYGRWTAISTPIPDHPGATDTQLVQVVSPLAHPSLAVRNEDYGGGSLGSPEMAMVWAQDKASAASGEIKFTQGSVLYDVTNDNLDDFNPQVVFLPDKTQLIVWQRMDITTPGNLNTDANAYLSHLQIAAVPFNYNSSARATPQFLSSDHTLNYRPQLVATSDGALAVWINNQSNQIMGDAPYPDRLMFARYTKTGSTWSWSTAAPALPNIAGLLDYKLASANGHVALVYSRDTDDDMTTDGDRELFYMTFENGAWSAPQRLTNDSVADEAPQLALTADGAPLVVWQRGGQLMFLNGSWTGIPALLDLPDAADRKDFELVGSIDGSAALTWQQVEPHDTRIGYAVYDAKYGRWSDARTIATNTAATSDTTTMANSIAAALAPADINFDGGREELFVGYQLANTQIVTSTVGGVAYPNMPQVGTQSLHLASIPMGMNLSISPSDITVTPSTAQPDDPLTVQAVIHNTGDLAVPGGTVPVVLNAGGDLAPTLLVTQTLPLLSAGESTTMNFPITRPASGKDQYQVEVNAVPFVFVRALNESNYDDNVAVVGSELAIDSLPTDYAPGGAIARAAITQSGGLYSSLSVSSTLRLGSPTGPKLSEAAISFPITPTATISSSAWISATLLGPGSHQVYWEVDPDHTLGEMNLDNNLMATTVDVLPDLTTKAALIGWGHDPGDAAPISMRVENRGNWASGASTAAVWDGPPGQPDSHALGRIAIPPIDPGGYVELSGALNLAGTPAAATGLQSLYVQLDPDNAMEEINENNNVARAGGVLGGPYPPAGTGAIYLPLIGR
jgi:hypothetical protein